MERGICVARNDYNRFCCNIKSGRFAEARKGKLSGESLMLSSVYKKGIKKVKSYSSFLVRCWSLQEEGEPKRVFNIKHIQSGQQTRTSDLSEAQAWMAEMTDSPQPETASDTEDRAASNSASANARK
jgi:hypothetical protein